MLGLHAVLATGNILELWSWKGAVKENPKYSRELVYELWGRPVLASVA